MKNSSPVAVVVTVLNEAKTIDGLIEALAEQTVWPAKVVIIDGGSSDGTFEKLCDLVKKYPRLHLNVLQKIGNRSVGRNYGIAHAQSQLVAITDAGCIPESNWLAELIRCQQESRAEVVAGYYFARPQSPFAEAVVPYVLVMPDRVNPRNFLPATRSMLISKNLWQRMGKFDETLSDNEDYAFARQLRDQHVRIGFTAAARVEWLPRTTLAQFAHMIFRFARGDAYAGAWRPKVGLIFLRYIFWLSLVLSFIATLNGWYALMFGGTFFIYLVWAIQKNLRYAPHGWYWLPILQVVSDAEVMRGTLVGIGKRLIKGI